MIKLVIKRKYLLFGIIMLCCSLFNTFQKLENTMKREYKRNEYSNVGIYKEEEVTVTNINPFLVRASIFALFGICFILLESSVNRTKNE